jgi:hypothetical protein
MIEQYIKGIIDYHFEPDEDTLNAVVGQIVYHIRLELENGVFKAIEYAFSGTPQ